MRTDDGHLDQIDVPKLAGFALPCVTASRDAKSEGHARKVVTLGQCEHVVRVRRGGKRYVEAKASIVLCKFQCAATCPAKNLLYVVV